MIRRPPRSTRTDTLFPYTTLFRSTSGILPTDLQDGMKRPERLLVAHPFNPVYLLPLVELVGGQRTAPETIERAKAIYTALGMHPLLIKQEIEAFVADRLLAAVWRDRQSRLLNSRHYSASRMPPHASET